MPATVNEIKASLVYSFLINSNKRYPLRRSCMYTRTLGRRPRRRRQKKLNLDKFNTPTANELELSSEAELFPYGQSERKLVLQINVNTLELVTE